MILEFLARSSLKIVDIVSEQQEIGLEMNITKIKAMRMINKLVNSQQLVIIDGRELETVESFIYLSTGTCRP